MLVVFFVISVVIAIVVLYSIISSSIKRSRKEKREGIISKAQLQVIQGISGTTEGQFAFLRLYDDRVTVNEQQTIPLSRIKEAVVFTQRDIENKDKSVVGRAIIGTALLGPLGAVVGGISGVGKKEKKITIEYLAIHYTNKDGVVDTAVFKNSGYPLFTFATKLNELLGITPGSPRQAFEI